MGGGQRRAVAVGARLALAAVGRCDYHAGGRPGPAGGRGYEQRTGKPCPEGFRRIRVHDLKHNFGRRLRAAGVSFEDRQGLLGHTSGRITTHYSGAELGNLIEAAERVCGEDSRKSPALVMLRQA